jgi:alkane 1-monooxygenase
MDFRSRNIRYLWSLTPGLVVVAGNLAGGWWVASNIVYSLGVVALAELLLPADTSNIRDPGNVLPVVVLYLHVVMQVLALATFFHALAACSLSGWQMAAAAVSTGIHSGSSAIVVAHELIHRKSAAHRLAGKLLLLSAGNVYFYVEHLRVHHKWVGMAKDPASARYGENVYHFFLRSVSGQTGQAFHLEAQRLREARRWPFGLANYVTASSVILLLALWGIGQLLGPAGILLFLLHGLTANFLLEYTNYIEHYGLARGENERVEARHAWQCDKPTSRFFLIDLSRHSDHHCHAAKPYHTLDSLPGSPVLPGGYITGIFLALLPPVWYSIVHARLESYMKPKHVE